jgi:hypothetical protein
MNFSIGTPVTPVVLLNYNGRMSAYRYFHAMLLSIGLTVVSSIVSTMLVLTTQEVYHIRMSSGRKGFLSSFFILETFAFSSIFMLSKDPIMIGRWILAILIMSILAKVDHRIGRISIVFPAISLIMVGFFYLLSNSHGTHFLGGVVNMMIGCGIYFSGRMYAHYKLGGSEVNQVFGFGDIYGLGTMGFFIGFPMAIYALIFVLILATLGAGIGAIIQKTGFLSRKIRLGSYFFLSTLCFLLIEAIQMSM